jgi:hypothetical protein
MVYDIFGRIVLSGRINNNEFDVSGLSSGIYILVIKTDLDRFSGKFIRK